MGNKRLRHSGSSIAQHASKALYWLWPPEPGAASYIAGHKLGEGNFGVTRLLLHKASGQQFAGKFLPLNQLILTDSRPQTTEDVKHEVLNHRLLDHENIVHFHEAYLTPEHLVVVTELANRGELFGVLDQGRLSEDDAQHLFRQLISAISYCHDNHVVHRDLKLENILLHEEPGGRMVLKIADFGFSKHALNQSTAHSFKGSPDYIAPEVIAASWRREGTRYDGKLVDTWSCGVILFLLVTGSYPFDAVSKSSGNTIKKNITNGAYQLPDGFRPSTDCMDLIDRILCPDPVERITIAEIKQHAWYLSGPEAAPTAARCKRAPSQQEEDVLRVLGLAVGGPKTLYV